jgi:hypothetical protein
MILDPPTACTMSSNPINPWAAAAFVLSLVSWVGFPVPIISIGLATLALAEMDKRGESGRTIAHFARAFALLVTVALLLRGGHTDWLTMIRW